MGAQASDRTATVDIGGLLVPKSEGPCCPSRADENDDVTSCIAVSPTGSGPEDVRVTVCNQTSKDHASGSLSVQLH